MRNSLVAVDHIMTSGLRVVCVISGEENEWLAEMLSFLQLGSVGYPLAWQKKWAVIGGLKSFLSAPCTSPTALPASSAPGCALHQHNFAPWQDVLAPKPLGAVSGTKEGDLIKKLKCALRSWPSSCLYLWLPPIVTMLLIGPEILPWWSNAPALPAWLKKIVCIASHVH